MYFEGVGPKLSSVPFLIRSPGISQPIQAGLACREVCYVSSSFFPFFLSDFGPRCFHRFNPEHRFILIQGAATKRVLANTAQKFITIEDRNTKVKMFTDTDNKHKYKYRVGPTTVLAQHSIKMNYNQKSERSCVGLCLRIYKPFFCSKT